MLQFLVVNEILVPLTENNTYVLQSLVVWNAVVVHRALKRQRRGWWDCESRSVDKVLHLGSSRLFCCPCKYARLALFHVG